MYLLLFMSLCLVMKEKICIFYFYFIFFFFMCIHMRWHYWCAQPLRHMLIYWNGMKSCWKSSVWWELTWQVSWNRKTLWSEIQSGSFSIFLVIHCPSPTRHSFQRRPHRVQAMGEITDETLIAVYVHTDVSRAWFIMRLLSDNGSSSCTFIHDWKISEWRWCQDFCWFRDFCCLLISWTQWPMTLV